MEVLSFGSSTVYDLVFGYFLAQNDPQANIFASPEKGKRKPFAYKLSPHRTHSLHFCGGGNHRLWLEAMNRRARLLFESVTRYCLEAKGCN